MLKPGDSTPPSLLLNRTASLSLLRATEGGREGGRIKGQRKRKHMSKLFPLTS